MHKSDYLTDILVFGAHPDDIELGCAGTLIKHIRNGRSVSLVDLTKGELGTRGTAEIRLREAEEARAIIGASDRLNLAFRDGFFKVDEEHIRKVVEIIRLKKPAIVLCNATDDRHPDHGRAATLIREACFYAGLAKFKTSWEDKAQEVHRTENVYHYVQFRYIRPQIIVDITDTYDEKMKSILAFVSQFYNPDSKEAETLISSRDFMDFVDARLKEFGRIIGTKYAEGFTSVRIPAVDDLLTLK